MSLLLQEADFKIPTVTGNPPELKLVPPYLPSQYQTLWLHHPKLTLETSVLSSE